METLSIRELLEAVTRGQIRIPAFQRGFVWDPERVAHLMDSIHKGYPFGSLLFWRTKEQLKSDRDLGPWKIPEPKEDYPVDYVLDGQQRTSSIFGVFQRGLEPDASVDWLPVFFDLDAETTAQESQFVALKSEDADPNRHFPLNTLFDSPAYRSATEAFSPETIKRIDAMQEVFKEMKIPVQVTKTEDKATVAIIFERVNRQGVELNTLQLLSAWTWSEDFQLQDQFTELAEEIEPFGFADLGGDTNLILRCCSAILAADSSPEALMSLNGGEVRDQFERITNGIKYAIDHLKSHYHVERLSNLPFTTLLVPLSVFYAVEGEKERNITDDQRKQIDRWFWRSSFSKRYSSGVIRNLNADIAQMNALRDGKPSTIDDIQALPDKSYFIDNRFGSGNVNTKTFILMLADHTPRSFSSGTRVNLADTLKAANRTEFHHLMPRAFLKETAQTSEIHESALVNFAFLSRADNRLLGGKAPSSYRTDMPENTEEILKSAICPESLFNDDYPLFADERAGWLVDKANKLCGFE